MARSDEAQAFFSAVYAAIQEIPPGKVTSYGHIAKLIGTRNTAQRPRQVGVCLKHLPNAAQPDGSVFHSGNVPWQRVINSRGVISPRNHPAGARNQATALRQEGVTVTTGAMGELSVNLGEYGWFPRQLPSEVAAGLEAEESSDSE